MELARGHNREYQQVRTAVPVREPSRPGGEDPDHRDYASGDGGRAPEAPRLPGPGRPRGAFQIPQGCLPPARADIELPVREKGPVVPARTGRGTLTPPPR